MKALRISVLTIVLLVVAGAHFYQQSAVSDWRRPLLVHIHPINADGSHEVAHYLTQLETSTFLAIVKFFEREARRYDIHHSPLLLIQRGKEIKSIPPSPPVQRDSMIRVVPWSLRLRYWVYQQVPTSGLATTTVNVFVLYYSPASAQRLEHSLGLSKGLIGVVHAYADPYQDAQNNVVIAHEILHTLGATDKYGQRAYPRFPEGFADPDQHPRFPQARAEIMGGRIPISEEESAMPDNLLACIIGLQTAKEIRWR